MGTSRLVRVGLSVKPSTPRPDTAQTSRDLETNTETGAETKSG